MRVWAAVVCISMACGGEGQRARAPEPEPVEDSEPSTAVDPDAWLDVVRGVRVDMRVGRPANERGTPIDEVEAAIREAGGTLDCSDLTWVTDEEGVNEAQCQGSIPIEGTQGIVTANVRKYEIPDEPDTPGLLNLVLGGPFLGANDDAIGEWVEAVRAKLESHYGAPMNADETDPADLRWRAADRHLVVHDPRFAPCGGECNAFVWVGGPEDPELGPRGF
ncbi:MAG: hypothetical protein JJ863_32620 [Deltaproteobacteria bacterium]|nr:hypothetical protein [Deltaproteobacteria bacterium]